MASDRLTLCFVSREYPPAPRGGIGTYLSNLLPRLAEKGHQVHMITEWLPGAPRKETQGNLTIHRLLFRDHEKDSGALHPALETLPGMKDLFSDRDFAAVFASQVSDYLLRLSGEISIDLIEAPEYEAPLFYFQTNRLLRQDWPNIPCAIHMHSPSERCNAYNHENQYSRLYQHRALHEHGSIAMADGLLAPSEFLARGTEHGYGLEPGSVRAIPPPMAMPPSGASKLSRRPNQILNVGRLSRAKGIDLLIEAGRQLRDEFEDLTIRIIGDDAGSAPENRSLADGIREKLNGEDSNLIELVPPMPREQLWEEFGRASIFCIPSRWESFGYTCAEAMACRTPVVAARCGGVEEMIEDGKTGVLCAPDSAEALAQALRRMLRAPLMKRQIMGGEAAKAIREICDDEKNTSLRADFYSEIIQRSKGVAPRIPSSYPCITRPLREKHHKRSETPAPAGSPPASVSVVIPCYNLGKYLKECLKSVRGQTRKPDEILIVDDGSNEEGTLRILRRLESQPDIQIIRIPNGGLARARNKGLAGTRGEYLIFLDADDLIEPTFIEKAAGAMDRHCELGAISSWLDYFGALDETWAPPHGQIPFLLAENTLTAGAMVRREAIDEAGGFNPAMAYGYEDWELWISIAEKGWALMVLPERLGKVRIRDESMLRGIRPPAHGYLRQTMVGLHPDLFARFGSEAMLIVEQQYREHGEKAQLEAYELRKRMNYLRRLPLHPLKALNFAAKKIAVRIRRMQRIDP